MVRELLHREYFQRIAFQTETIYSSPQKFT